MRVNENQKLIFLELIKKYKNTIIPKYGPLVSPDVKRSAWNKIIAECEETHGFSIAPNRPWTYVRDVCWPNIRNYTLRKRERNKRLRQLGGICLKYSKVDKAVFDILSSESEGKKNDDSVKDSDIEAEKKPLKRTIRASKEGAACAQTITSTTFPRCSEDDSQLSHLEDPAIASHHVNCDYSSDGVRTHHIPKAHSTSMPSDLPILVHSVRSERRDFDYSPIASKDYELELMARRKMEFEIRESSLRCTNLELQNKKLKLEILALENDMYERS